MERESGYFFIKTYGDDDYCFIYEDEITEINEERILNPDEVCDHVIASAKNEVVEDGFICIKCGKLFKQYKK